MATPQNMRYIHPHSPTLTSPISPYTSHLSPYTFLYLPIPFSPSSHSHILHSPLSPSTLSPHSPHNPLTFSIPQSPIFPITQYNAHIPTITPIPTQLSTSPHTRPCNISVLLYTILCTLTHSSIFPTYCST